MAFNLYDILEIVQNGVERSIAIIGIRHMNASHFCCLSLFKQMYLRLKCFLQKPTRQKWSSKKSEKKKKKYGTGIKINNHIISSFIHLFSSFLIFLHLLFLLFLPFACVRICSYEYSRKEISEKNIEGLSYGLQKRTTINNSTIRIGKQT